MIPNITLKGKYIRSVEILHLNWQVKTIGKTPLLILLLIIPLYGRRNTQATKREISLVMIFSILPFAACTPSFGSLFREQLLLVSVRFHALTRIAWLYSLDRVQHLVCIDKDFLERPGARVSIRHLLTRITASVLLLELFGYKRKEESYGSWC